MFCLILLTVCQVIPTVMNANVVPSTGPLNTGETLTVTCEDGYLFSGSTVQTITVSCQINGEFYPPIPVCVRGK